MARKDTGPKQARQSKATKAETTRTQTPKPGTFATDVGVTNTFLDDLPLGDFGPISTDETVGRQAYAGTANPAAIVHLAVRFVTVQYLFARSAAGGAATAQTTDHYRFGNTDRFFVAGGKLCGVVRTFLSETPVCDCGDMTRACGNCLFCRLFGYFADGRRARVTFGDLISEQEYRPELRGALATTTGSLFTRQRGMVPPGTEFWSLISIMRPTRADLSTLAAALPIVSANRGIGSETTHYGRMTTEFAGVIGGYLPNVGNGLPFAEAGQQGKTSAEVVQGIVDALPFRAQALVGNEAALALEKLSRLSPVSPNYGESVQ